ncbi:putative cytochrome P450 6a23 [Megachile rotundata]|uniref:putative cytochrome P450 6a23 n=1 Tax=Megachile rotundata TaxID=143995 RepID=UPI003FD552D4
MPDYFQILIAIVAVLFSVYLYVSYTAITQFWRKLNVPGPKPNVVFGNLKGFITQKKSVSDIIKELYEAYKHEPVFGIFQARTPILVINDLDLAKDVLIKDFSLFVNRGIPYFEKVEPLGQHLFLLEAERWRPLRVNLSPVFTSGKLKEMFPLIVDCSKHLEKYLDTVASKGEPIECRELAAKFTTDVIGNCAFGIDMNALEDDDSEFRKMGRKIFVPSFKTTMRNLLRQTSPSLYKIIGHKLQPEGVDNFFTKVVVDTIKYRKSNNVSRPDFINMLMELKEHPEKLHNVDLTDSLLTSQAFVFFVAGFETSSTTISHALYELALNHEIQDKLRAEIKESDEKHGETLTYDRVKQMKYLDKVFKETLRKYPVLPMLTRQALEDYTFRGTKVTIPKGTQVWIPVIGIQSDPNIYPNPETFDPERFEEEAVAARHQMTFLPFGDGPRNCIGARFAVFQTKVGIITVLRNYKVDVCEKTTVPYKADPRAFLLTLQGGVNLKIVKV